MKSDGLGRQGLRGTGFDALRPIGLVSMLQRIAARYVSMALGNDMFPQKSNGYAYRKGGSIDVALITRSLGRPQISGVS